MADELDAEDLAAARDRLTHLCSRRPVPTGHRRTGPGHGRIAGREHLGCGLLSLFWGAVAGVRACCCIAAASTLDAMVGYRNDRYERFGKASARLDDVVAFTPARLAGAMSCVVAPLVGGSAQDAARVMLRDASAHPSPNGGWCEAAWAGALGVRLGGASNYHGRVEERPALGDENAPGPDAVAVRRASRMVGLVTAASAVIAVAISGGFGRK